MIAKSVLTPGRFIKLVGGAGTAFVFAQFAWGSERFYGEVVSSKTKILRLAF